MTSDHQNIHPKYDRNAFVIPDLEDRTDPASSALRFAKGVLAGVGDV
jgi:hypothetical protein